MIVALMQSRSRAQIDIVRRRLGSSTSSSNNSRNRNGYRSSYNNRYYNSDSSEQNYYNGARDFSVCDDSVVKVLELYILCDSPYTFYYGNGANRHSPVCNYGDRISFEVRFQVQDDIQENEPIYATIALYDDQGNFLSSTDPTNLCNEYVGSDCTYAGYYKFSSRMRLPYPSSDGSYTERFLPQMHVAFSTREDSGYNLGAMNIECDQWNDITDGATWLADRPQRSRMEGLVLNYGMLILSCTMLMSLAYCLWRQASHQRMANGNANLLLERQTCFIALD
ncbi:hypothetical protein MPSEU_000575000 [Mayamaea pseudoterrestris]|nr:hypothetical protein MPSEU_000575000 [Mayamaea pseudoterrestris]